MSTVETCLVSPGCKNEITLLCRSLHMQQREDEWMASLKSIESKRSLSSLNSLLMLKALISSTMSVEALRNLVQLFLRKVSFLMDEHNISKMDKLAKQALKIVNDFWSLVSNQHVVLTQQAFGSYSPLFFDVLPSLASVYVDLFIAVYSTRSTIDRSSKRLCSWLMFELNERCIKTALLEVYECTKAGARLLLPLLKKLLSKPPDNKSNIDYLLHFILLKRWAFVCTELCDVIQTSLNIKAPSDFLKWLTQYWPKAVEYYPSDKSLKGRRVSEVLLELDHQAIEDLIDVFSRYLLSKEQVFEEKQNAEQEMIKEIFIIDKKGEELHSAEHTESLKKKRKLWHEKAGCNSTLLSKDSNQRRNDSDIFMLPGLLDDSTENSNSEKPVRKSGKFKKETISVSESEKEIILQDDMEHEECLTKEGLTSNNEFTDLSGVGKNESKITIIDGMKVQIFDDKNSMHSNTDEEQVDDLPIKTYTEIESRDKNKFEDKKRHTEMIHSYKNDAQSTNWGNQSILDSDLYIVSSSDEENIIESSCRKNESTNLKALSVLQNSDIDLTVHHITEFKSKNNKNRSRGINLSKIQKSYDTVKTVSNFDHQNTTEFQVGLMLSEIRESMQDKRNVAPSKSADNSLCIKTRLRTKSESMTQAGNLQKTESKVEETKTSTVMNASGNDFKDWLRKSPSRLLKKHLSLKSATMKDEGGNEKDANLTLFSDMMPTVKNLRSGGRKSASGKRLAAVDVLGTPMKTYSGKDTMITKTCSTPSQLAHELPSAEASEESQQNRYFLRTNCSHRLLNNESCPTCSSQKITLTKM